MCKWLAARGIAHPFLWLCACASVRLCLWQPGRLVPLRFCSTIAPLSALLSQVEVEDPALRPEDISDLIEEALRLPGDKKRKADAAGT